MTHLTCCLDSSRSIGSPAVQSCLSGFNPGMGVNTSGTETTCCGSKMPLSKKHCNYWLSACAQQSVCVKRAKNALLRTKTLGFWRSAVDHHQGDHHDSPRGAIHGPLRGIFGGVCVTDRDLMQLDPSDSASPPGGALHQVDHHGDRHQEAHQ